MSYIHLEKIKESKATIKSLDNNKRKNYEQNSGFSFKDVEVHYNSDLPNKVKCYGLTFGSKIAIAPGKEHVLDHELGHVMQQKQHRVHAQQIVGGDPWNFNKQKEIEATSIGNQLSQSNGSKAFSLKESVISQPILQGATWEEIPDRNEFIMEEHHEVIENQQIEKFISFRRAGKDTIERMKLKSGHKGHNVLEKSIKDKTIEMLISKNEFTDSASEEAERNKLKAYSGLIGHWESNMKKLSGVYVSELGVSIKKTDMPFEEFVKRLEADEQKKVTEEKESYETAFKNFKEMDQTKIANGDEKYVNISDDLGEIVNTSKKGKIFSRLFLTGDYDIHDIGWLSNGGNWRCGDENPSLDLIDYQMMNKTNDLKFDMSSQKSQRAGKNSFFNVDMSYIRHGAQANYVQHMSTTESEHGKKMPYAVINADPDLLFFNPKGKNDYQNWYRTKTMSELLVYYKEALNITPPAYYGETRKAHLEQAKERYNNLRYKEGTDYEDIKPLVKKYNDKLAKTKNNYKWLELNKKRYEKLGIADKESLNEESDFKTVIDSLLELKEITMKSKWKEDQK